MECSPVNLSAVSPNESLGARQHFLRSAAGESEKKDAFGFYAAIDEMSDAINERARLTGTCTCNDQEWTVAVSCCRSLLRIQIRCEFTRRARDNSVARGVNTDRVGNGVRHVLQI